MRVCPRSLHALCLFSHSLYRTRKFPSRDLPAMKSPTLLKIALGVLLILGNWSLLHRAVRRHCNRVRGIGYDQPLCLKFLLTLNGQIVGTDGGPTTVPLRNKEIFNRSPKEIFLKQDAG